MSTQIGFLIGFKELEIWLFPESMPSLNADSGTVTYTMSGDSKSLLIGNGAAVGEFASAVLGSLGDAAANTAAAATGTALTNLWSQFPEPFKSFATGVASTISAYQYHLESLRLTLTFKTVGGVKQYTTSYEMGVSVQINEAGPGPLKDFSLKRIYLKLAA